MSTIPKVFISYSWSSEEYKRIVLNLAERLRANGVDVILDQWDLLPGYDKYVFMEQSIKKADKVLILCDQMYADKANARQGGVGDETTIITPDVYGHHKQEKFIPVIMESFEAMPLYLRSRLGVDYRGDKRTEEGFRELLRAIYGKPVSAKPELGKAPDWGSM